MGNWETDGRGPKHHLARIERKNLEPRGLVTEMGPVEHQRKLDERYEVDTALMQAVMMCQSVMKVLEERTDELNERVTALEKVVEAMLEKRRSEQCGEQTRI
ncbi:hypothetical protein LCGC14_3046650 [marine sediment metagenome]|uniref:Uncharacterized protein n=1 Tax=marine sediment metagenome TaxID=412755 RepID=A0A0F8WND9_9ZZZZ